DLGGPGRLPYGTAQEAPEAVTFEASTDALVLELQKLCNEDRWKDALARVEEIAKDKKLKAAEKAGAKKVPKEMEKAAKAELARLEKALQQNLKDENLPRPGHVKRVRAICEAWPAETWVAKKGYLELLARFEGDFAPVRREREREAAMREARSLESQADKRAEAKAAYEALAKRKAEDNGSSIWPQAAEYRLMWWQDLE
ncbi:MAG: hypothetical protein IT463_11210, partial [Planctomycetes bacterium]|nr:hypothetical protein [Planctomycetota bacterium]